jgi:hypothetical protein
MMARKTFYSFHYVPDNWRVSQIRNIGVVEGNPSASDHDWEAVKKGGDTAIKKWIDGQLEGRTCTVVLIGAETAGRKWINYEIESSWNSKKGVLGINIHNLKNAAGSQSIKGANPFETFTFGAQKTPLTSVVKTYDPPYTDSKQVYDFISKSISQWIEDAVAARKSV